MESRPSSAISIGSRRGNSVSTTGSIVGYMYIFVDPIDPHHRWQSKLLTLEEARVHAQALVDDFATRGESAELVIAEVRVIERMA